MLRLRQLQRTLRLSRSVLAALEYKPLSTCARQSAHSLAALVCDSAALALRLPLFAVVVLLLTKHSLLCNQVPPAPRTQSSAILPLAFALAAGGALASLAGGARCGNEQLEPGKFLSVRLGTAGNCRNQSVLYAWYVD